jgi:hypothetical protein
MRKILAALFAPALALGAAQACEPAPSQTYVPYWPIIGDNIFFPARTQIACVDQAQALVASLPRVTGLTDCYALNANKNYQILEARPMNDNVYYRVALKDGTLVWTLINNPHVAICK